MISGVRTGFAGLFAIAFVASTAVLVPVVFAAEDARPPKFRFAIDPPDLKKAYRDSDDPSSEVSPEFARTFKAVRKYSIPDGHCTLVVTSSDCHALTAAHCLEPTLSDLKAFDWLTVVEGRPPLKQGYVKPGVLPKKLTLGQKQHFKWLKPGEPSRLVVDGVEKPLSKQSLDFFDKKFESRSEGRGVLMTVDSTRLELLAMGRGIEPWIFATVDPNRTTYNRAEPRPAIATADDYFSYVKTSSSGVLADWALVKLPEENCACVQTGDSNAKGDFTVAGYSGDAAQEFEVGRALTGVPYSKGPKCEEPTETLSVLDERYDFFDKILVHMALGYYTNHFDDVDKAQYRHLKDKMLSIDARASGGASGGGIFNSKGELSAVNTMVQQRLNRPSQTMGVRIEEVQRQLQKQVSPEVFGAAFKCP